MKVRCSANTGAELPESYLDPRAGRTRSLVFPLTVGAIYTVYAMLFRSDGIWYHLINDDGLPYPMAYPAPLFDITSSKLSCYWYFATTPQDAKYHHLAVLAIRQWAQDAYFYDRLTSGIPEDVATFTRARALMDREES
jgi:hypothetical protein